MKALFIVCVGVGLAAWCCGESRAQQTPPDSKAIEGELDRFRNDLFHAFNQADYKGMLEKYCHKDVIATWQDGTTSKGHEEVLAEFAKLKTFIDKMVVDPNTDKRLILNDGKLVIASGNMKDQYALRRGRDVTLNSRWQATLVRDEERWLLLGFSASTDAFDNEVVDLYLRQAHYVGAGLGASIALVLGIVGTLLVVKRRRSA